MWVKFHHYAYVVDLKVVYFVPQPITPMGHTLFSVQFISLIFILIRIFHIFGCWGQTAWYSEVKLCGTLCPDLLSRTSHPLCLRAQFRRSNTGIHSIKVKKNLATCLRQEGIKLSPGPDALWARVSVDAKHSGGSSHSYRLLLGHTAFIHCSN